MRAQCRLSGSNGGSDRGLGRGARAAGANRVMPAVVWLSQAGHRGSAGLSYGGGRGNEAQGHGRDGSGRDWGGEEMV